MLIDTHCHLDFPPFVDHLEQYLTAAYAAGVRRWIVPGVHPDAWKLIVRLCEQFDGLYPAFGIHPRHAAEVSDRHLIVLEELALQGVAIGETGLDRHCGNLLLQEELFRRQIRIAVSCKLPLLIHCRDMTGRTLEILHDEQAGQVGGLMHAYSGSVESAREFIGLGFAISIGGTLKRRNAVRLPQLARELPLSCLVMETDAPDTGPHAEQSARNWPVMLSGIAGELARIRGITVDEVVLETGRTALRVIPKLGADSCR